MPSSHLVPLSGTAALTFSVDPLRIQIGQDSLVTLLLKTLWRLLVHQTATPPPPPVLLVFLVCAHPVGRWYRKGRRGIHLVGKGDAAALQECVGRQFGGVFVGTRSVGLRMRVRG